MAKSNGRKKLNPRDAQRARNAEAMPEVKKLVNKFGRMAVANCIGKIKARDKEAARIAAMRKQLAELERGLR